MLSCGQIGEATFIPAINCFCIQCRNMGLHRWQVTLQNVIATTVIAMQMGVHEMCQLMRILERLLDQCQCLLFMSDIARVNQQGLPILPQLHQRVGR